MQALVCSILYLMGEERSMIFKEHVVLVVSHFVIPWTVGMPGSSVHGILQAIKLDWVIILFSRKCFPHRDKTQVSCIPGRFFTIWAPGKSSQKAWVSGNAPLRNRDHDNWWAFSNYTSSLPRFSESPRSVCVLSHFSHVPLFATLWTIAHQAPLSLGFSKHNYWNGLLFPPSGDLPNPGIKPTSPVALQVDSLPLSH